MTPPNGPGPVAYPLHVDAHGATARTDDASHLSDLIEQVLFTAPGERVNRPDFGAGLGQLLFAPVGPEVAATTQLLVHGALQQWLGDVIDVAEVLVTAQDATLVVEVSYAARATRQPGTVRFAIEGGAT
jgi:phage baseplate assembly protein W